VLVMGCAFGAFMGLLIDALKIPAFIITLAGMFFLRGQLSGLGRVDPD
jgi:simple sugar transport system permease protein